MHKKNNVFTAYFLLMFSSLGFAEDFGYYGGLGPDRWGDKFDRCAGKHQSPVNIKEEEVEMINLFPLEFEHFDEIPDFITVKNNGHTVVCTVTSHHRPIIRGGPLIGTYELAQFHFHWGSHDWEGSENTINNRSFPMELHMVFFNSAYTSFDDATYHPDGLTVLSFLYTRSHHINPNYDSLILALSSVINVHETTSIDQPPPLHQFLNGDRSIYYTYGGSLTTPPCSEIVTWIEFKDPIPLAHTQIAVFRKLKGSHGNLTRNFRPTQPLHGRVIRMNRDVSSSSTALPSRLLLLSLILSIVLPKNDCAS